MCLSHFPAERARTSHFRRPTPTAAENGTDTNFRPALAFRLPGRRGYLARHNTRPRQAKNGASPGFPAWFKKWWRKQREADNLPGPVLFRRIQVAHMQPYQIEGKAVTNIIGCRHESAPVNLRRKCYPVLNHAGFPATVTIFVLIYVFAERFVSCLGPKFLHDSRNGTSVA